MFREASAYVEQAVRRLDPTGEGFQTNDAADCIVEKVIEDYELTAAGGGPVTDAPLTLMRNGAAALARGYDPARKRKQLATKVVGALAAEGQGDFAQVDDDFAWAYEYTALSEDHDTTRKQYVHLTFAEAVCVVALKLKKSREAAAAAKRVQTVIDRFPHWRDRPDLTLGEILGDD